MLSASYYHISVAIVWSIASLNAYATVQFNLYSARVDSPLRLLMTITLISSVVVIVASYLTIWIAAKRNQLPRRASKTTEQNRKLAKSLLIITVVSIITFLPISIYFCFSDPLQHLHSFGVQITLVTQYSNSFLNPIIYRIKIPEFRMSLKKSVFCRCHPRQRSVSLDDCILKTASGITIKTVKQFEQWKKYPRKILYFSSQFQVSSELPTIKGLQTCQHRLYHIHLNWQTSFVVINYSTKT